MRQIFLISFILLSFCSFSQTWECSDIDFDLNITQYRLKKVSDGVYSLKNKVTIDLADEYIMSGDVKRYKKGENGQEFCNWKASGNVKGQELNYNGKVLLKHEGDKILWFDWDEWNDKPEKEASMTFTKVK